MCPLLPSQTGVVACMLSLFPSLPVPQTDAHLLINEIILADGASVSDIDRVGQVGWPPIAIFELFVHVVKDL